MQSPSPGERLVTNDRTGDGHLPGLHEPAVYRIRVAGRLGPKWADRVVGMQIVVVVVVQIAAVIVVVAVSVKNTSGPSGYAR